MRKKTTKKTLPWTTACPKGKTQEWNWEKSHLIVLTVFQRFPKWAVSRRVIFSLSLCEAQSCSKSFSTMQAWTGRLPPNTDREMVKEERQREEKKNVVFPSSCHPLFWWDFSSTSALHPGYKSNGVIFFKAFSFGSSPEFLTLWHRRSIALCV